MAESSLTGHPQHPAPVSSSSRAAVATGSSSQASIDGDPSHGRLTRRSQTLDGSFTMRARRQSPTLRQFFSDSSSEAPPRRSSNFSEYSLKEARGILNPRPSVHGAESHHETSPLASLSLAFALLPAVAGALFKNGSSVATDVLLLGLAAIFLHWSVTQPWLWYHDAQEVRIQEEADLETAVEEDEVDSDSDVNSPQHSPLENVLEEEEEATEPAPRRKSPRTQRMTLRQQAAIKELYRHEVLALLSCFVFPLLSAYALHAMRSQLSRPSEGLVSNYNLTIFLMVSELRVFSHIIKLVQSRTLRLQRIVHQSPYGVPVRAQVDGLRDRLERLEAMSLKEQMLAERGAAFDTTKASMARDIRNAIQPELDALNRAVRRYEKKTLLLQAQTEARISDLDERLQQVVALTTSTAKNGHGGVGMLSRMIRSLAALVASPLHACMRIVSLPIRPILALMERRKQPAPSSPRTPGSTRSGKTPLPVRYFGERVPTRLSKK